MRLIAKVVVLLFATCLTACGLKHTTYSRTKAGTSTATSSDATKPRRAAFTGADVTAIELLPLERVIEPWTKTKLQLVGTFRDGTKASILEDVTWKVAEADASKFIIDAKTGEFVASEPVNYKLDVSWHKLAASTNLFITYAKNSLRQTLPSPVQVDLKEVEPGKLKISWAIPAEYVTGYTLAYAKDLAPTDCEEPLTGPQAGVTYVGPDVLKDDAVSHEITVENSSGNYTFSICSLQRHEHGGKALKRKSLAVVKSLQLKEQAPAPKALLRFSGYFRIHFIRLALKYAQVFFRLGASMNSLSDKSQSLRFLQGIEAGTLSTSDAYNIVKDRDPVLVYFLLRYLREKYNASHPDAPVLQQRILELTGTYTDIQKMLRAGEQDPMREWFEDSHSVREFARDAEAFVDLIIDKLEG